MRVLHLYRPRLPSSRAQSIQVLGTCWGLAAQGCEVTLLADPAEDRGSAEAALAAHGLPPLPGLRVELAPTRWPPGAGAWARWRTLGWLRAGPGVLLGRTERGLGPIGGLPGLPPRVLEAHGLDSALEREAGRDPGPALARERALLRGVAALVTNCAGTLALWEQAHGPDLPALRRVVWNATGPGRGVERRPGWPPTVGYLGSLRPFKGLRTLLEAAAGLPEPLVLELLGGSEAERAALGPLPPRVHALGERPYTALPAHLAHWAGAVVALDDNTFGRHLCNPLKLWDYLATGLPLVVPELPTLREVLGDHPARWYTPGDAAGLRDALRHVALQHGPGARWERTWQDRAAELLPILEAVAR